VTHVIHLHYLPIALPLFLVLVGVLALLLIALPFQILRHVYMSLGVSSGAALLILAASLLGSFFNIPVAELPGRQVDAARQITVFGVTYLVPVAVDWPGTIIAVNVGGAVIPTAVSLYLIARRNLWVSGAIAVAIVSLVCHALARPVPSLGIAMPTFAPGVSAGIVALLISRRNAAPLAYVGGSLGALIGADLTNLYRLQGLGASVASIGGAGAFDGIFLTGVVAVLIAGLSPVPGGARRRQAG